MQGLNVAEMHKIGEYDLIERPSNGDISTHFFDEKIMKLLTDSGIIYVIIDKVEKSYISTGGLRLTGRINNVNAENEFRDYPAVFFTVELEHVKKENWTRNRMRLYRHRM